ncbi:MAG: hypothetical protein J6W52_00165 [Bacteroidaceae bacterium]|nr:hypothetical protein [Bacteroidaceae bacterium]
MKKTLSFIIISLTAFCAYAQNLYIGSFYVTTTDTESLYGDGNNKWANRRTIICDMFNFEQPDLLGLQGATNTQISFIKTRLTGYGLAGNILYKNTLQLDSCGTVTDMPDGSACSWARLRKGETAFYVFNISFSATTTVASSSATRLLTAIGEINPDKLPTFIVGNLGVSESTTAYNRLNGRYPDSYTKAATVSAEFGTVNNFDLAANHGTSRFDFVFVPRTATVQAYGQLQYGYYTQESDGSHKRRLPSTHFPVMAKVTLP